MPQTIMNNSLLSEISNYLQTKYLVEPYYDSEYIYVPLTTGRLIIPIDDLTKFITKNIAQYESLSFTIYDLIDIFIMNMIINALNFLTNEEFQNTPEILLQ